MAGNHVAQRRSEKTDNKRILVSCLSNLEIDPRVRREIDWLTERGFVVETLGEGNLPSPEVVAHHRITDDRPTWTKPRLIYGLLLLLLPYSSRFRLFYESRIPRELTQRFLAGEFDLVVLNDLDLLPWAVRKHGPRVKGSGQHVHLDLHEYHTKKLPAGSHWKFLMDGFWGWLRTFIASPGITSRTVVAPGIGRIYEEELGVPPQITVRNAPPLEKLSPSRVDPQRIELLYHGLGMWERGLQPLIEAMSEIEPRFHLKLMLTGSSSVVKDELKRYVAEHKLTDRVTFADPVAMKDVAKTINTSDLEVIFYKPTTPNLQFSLPNKFFESIQARLGIVVGESPSMTEIVEPHRNGIIVSGWEPADLARGINTLTAGQISKFKEASDRIAKDYCMASEGDTFVSSLKM